MARARRRVFERSVFEPLADAIAACVAAEPGRERFSVLDVGCGEGYYIGSVARSVATSTVQAACFIGVDVSKETLKLAARAHRSVCFLVNDARYRLTVADGSIDVLLDVFAPRNAAEFTRVVRDGGLLLVAIPLAHHLRELRERLPLLGIEDRKRQRAIDQLGAAFALERAQSVEYTRVLASDAVLDLLRMTPNAWHLDTAAFEQVGSWGPLEVTFGVEVLALRKIVPGTHFSEIRARHEFSGGGTDPADST